MMVSRSLRLAAKSIAAWVALTGLAGADQQAAGSAAASANGAAPSAPMVALSPVPGVSLSIPKGWIACDSATNKLLGEADDPNGLKKDMCGYGGISLDFRVFNPAPFRTISFTITYSKKQDIRENEIAAITPEIMAGMQTEMCNAAAEPLRADDQIDSCKSEIGQFAGHNAFISTIVATPKGGTKLQQFEIVSYEFPYSEGYLVVQFNTPVFLKSATEPVIDAIRKSIVVK